MLSYHETQMIIQVQNSQPDMRFLRIILGTMIGATVLVGGICLELLMDFGHQSLIHFAGG